MTVNTDKTKILIFNRKGILQKSNIMYNQNLIDSKDVYKYLDILFHISGKLQQCRCDLSKRGLKAIFKMKSSFASLSPKFETNMHVFDHIIEPVLLYGTEIWSPSILKRGNIDFDKLNKDEFEKCHLQFIRYSLCLNKRTPFYAIYGETGRYPLIIKSIERTLTYWLRLQNLSVSTLAGKAFGEMLKEKNNFVWYDAMKRFFKMQNMHHSRVIQLSKTIIKNIISNLKQNFHTFLKERLFNDNKSIHGNKMRGYRKYKSTHVREEYLGCLSKELSCNLARLRLSSHRLEIECK